jgi:predicted naringenin-chalcone synthase
MPTYLHTVETWTPPHVHLQDRASIRMQAQFDDPKFRRMIRHVYRHSDIDARHTCVPFDGSHGPFAADEHGKWANPPTGDRNRVFRDVSRLASPELARKTLDASPYSAADVTHVVTASCTGFYNPGPDFDIIRGLGLSPSVQRFHLGFMGCYAAFPALRLAHSLSSADPSAVVLIQCLELCSLHVQLDTLDPETMISASLFADGAGCAILSARPPAPGARAWRLNHLASALTPNGAESMAWEIGNHGYEIVLSTYVPSILGENIRAAVLPNFGNAGFSFSDVRNWAVHPGGKSILDRVGDALDLPPAALDMPRDILRRHGNMSSATLFFLLKEASFDGPTAAMAFGPGLTVEMAFLQPVHGDRP